MGNNIPNMALINGIVNSFLLETIGLVYNLPLFSHPWGKYDDKYVSKPPFIYGENGI